MIRRIGIVGVLSCILCAAAFAGPAVTDAVKLAPAKMAAISPDGSLIASGQSGTVSLWNTADGKPAGTLEGHQGEIYTLIFSNDGSLLAVSGASDGKVVTVFDVKNRKQVAAVKPDKGAIVALGFSADNATLIAGGQAINAYHLPDGAVTKTIALPANEGACMLSSDGKEVISIGKFSGKLTAWDLSTGQQSARQFKQDAASTPSMGGEFAAAGPDKIAVASFMSNAIFVFDLKSGALDHKIGNIRLQRACFTADGKHVVYGTWETMSENFVCVADAGTGKTSVKIGPFGKETVFATAPISPDGKTLVAVPNQGSSPVLMWHLP